MGRSGMVEKSGHYCGYVAVACGSGLGRLVIVWLGCLDWVAIVIPGIEAYVLLLMFWWTIMRPCANMRRKEGAGPTYSATSAKTLMILELLQRERF